MHLRRSSVRQFPMPVWPNSGKYMWCKWCGEPIPKVIDGKSSTQRMWHPACVREYELHTRLERQFDYLVDRDGKRCACCPEGAPEPKKWLRLDSYGHREFADSRRFYTPTPEDLARLWPNDPVVGKRWHEMSEVERAYGTHFRIELVCGLEVDHRVPLWEVTDKPDDERRWYFGPGNLWLLCPRHHKEKTRREAARRAWIRKLEKAQLGLPL